MGCSVYIGMSGNLVYNDGCIYLANCNINGKSTNYTYGTSRQKITEDLKPILYLYPAWAKASLTDK